MLINAFDSHDHFHFHLNSQYNWGFWIVSVPILQLRSGCHCGSEAVRRWTFEFNIPLKTRPSSKLMTGGMNRLVHLWHSQRLMEMLINYI